MARRLFDWGVIFARCGCVKNHPNVKQGLGAVDFSFFSLHTDLKVLPLPLLSNFGIPSIAFGTASAYSFSAFI